MGGNIMPAGVVMYGVSPMQPWTPDIIPNPTPYEPQPFDREVLEKLFQLPKPALTPCGKCKRHVVTGMDCPFCFAREEIARQMAMRDVPTNPTDAAKFGDNAKP